MIDPTNGSRLQDASQEEVDRLLGEIATEFFARITNGESPRIEDYTARHPQLAAMIRQALTVLQVVGESVADGKTRSFSGTSGGDSSSVVGTEKQLGDFRILQELGRGGMGVVYEAEQISMGGRRVALKVLPFAAMADPRHLQRFHNEVRAAASLDHPNIVSVYSVGQDRGVHFYAMRLIRGQSMGRLIQELAELRRHTPLSAVSVKEAISSPSIPAPSSGNTDPTEAWSGEAIGKSGKKARAGESETAAQPQALISTKGNTKRSDYYEAIADLAIQAAEALEHAHERGVTHRDIKPANLMIDAFSQLYITDFGLAHIEEGVGMTMTGDLIGTLRYMSPEQAMGKRVVVDYRTDIYSLGVSLYELLTTQPAFDGENRAAMLKQIAFEEPRKLTQVDPSIPRDLETIVHKAMAKSPDERYASAQELADDLRAFRACQPIMARPPSVIDRFRKYTRRNQGLVATTMIVLALTTIGLATSNARVAFQRREAEQRRSEAEENLQIARETVDTYLKLVSEDVQLNTPSMQPLRTRFLELALEYYEQILEKHSYDPKLEAEYARAHYQIGNIGAFLGDRTLAAEAHKKALEIRRRLFQARPFDEKLRYDLGVSCDGLFRSVTHTMDEAESLSRECVSALEPLGSPEHRKTLAEHYLSLGALHHNAYHQGIITDRSKAKNDWKQAEQIMEELVRLYPDVPEHQFLLARIYTMDPTKGEEALSILETLVQNRSDDLGFQKELSEAYVNVYVVTGCQRLDLLEKAINVLEKLVQENPSVVLFKTRLSDTLQKLAEYYEPRRMWHQALEVRQSQLEILESWATGHPDDANLRIGLALVYGALGRAQLGLEQHENAVATLEKSVSTLRESKSHQVQLAEYLFCLGEAQKELGLLERATGSVLEALETRGRKEGADDFEAVLSLSQKCQPFQDWLTETGRPSDAMKVASGAIAFLAGSGVLETGSPYDAQRARGEMQKQFTFLVNSFESSQSDDNQYKILSEQLKFWENLSQQANLIRILQLDLHLRLAGLHGTHSETGESSTHCRQADVILEEVKDDPMLLEILVPLTQPIPVLCEARSMTKDEPNGVNRTLARCLETGLELAREQAKNKASEPSYEIWARFAIAHYRVCDWHGAEHEARLAAQYADDQPANLCNLATLFLLADKRDEYHQLCQRLMERWQEWEGTDLGHAAELCTLDPTEPDDPSMLMRLAKRSVAEGPDWSSGHIAFAQSRVGDYRRSIDWNEGWAAEDKQSPWPRYCLAIAHQMAGNHKQAVLMFEEAEELAKNWLSPWANVWLYCQALRKEAKERIGVDPR